MSPGVGALVVSPGPAVRNQVPVARANTSARAAPTCQFCTLLEEEVALVIMSNIAVSVEANHALVGE